MQTNCGAGAKLAAAAQSYAYGALSSWPQAADGGVAIPLCRLQARERLVRVPRKLTSELCACDPARASCVAESTLCHIAAPCDAARCPPATKISMRKFTNCGRIS